MSNIYDNVVGGKLKLKGGSMLRVKKKKKKKKSKRKGDKLTRKAEIEDSTILNGEVILDLSLLVPNQDVNKLVNEKEILKNRINDEDELTGWFPIFDSLEGLRGKLKLTVKVEYFNDINPFRASSAGVRFCSGVYPGLVQNGYNFPFNIIKICGFVEELIVEDDPEHHWADSFRSARAANHSRMLLLYQMTGRLRRHVGRKAVDMGANGVLGFSIGIDLEARTDRIVMRATGTACIISSMIVNDDQGLEGGTDKDIGGKHKSNSVISKGSRSSNQSGKNLSDGLGRDGEEDNQKKKVSSGNPLTQMPRRTGKAGVNNAREVILLTLRNLPVDLGIRAAGIVSSRSVKLLDTTKKKLRKLRDLWWAEVRHEVKTHARALGCGYVLGYSESTTIRDDLCILTATGTAVNVVRLNFMDPLLTGIKIKNDNFDLIQTRSRRSASLMRIPAI